MPGNHHHTHPHKKQHHHSNNPAANTSNSNTNTNNTNNNNQMQQQHSREGKSNNSTNYINNNTTTNNNNYYHQQQQQSMPNNATRFNHNYNSSNNKYNNYNNSKSIVIQPNPSTLNNRPSLTPSPIPSASSALKSNNLRKKLEIILEERIAQNDLCFSICNHYRAIINHLEKIKFDSKEKLQSFLFLKSQLDAKFEFYIVKKIIIPHLIIALGVEAYEVNQNSQQPSAIPDKKSYNLTARPKKVESQTEQAKLIELAPKLSSSGNAYFSLEFDSVSVITRLFYELIKTSKKLFRLMNIKIIYEKNGFENLDFTSLKKTLSFYKHLLPAHATFMKLKGIRNDWAHFVNPTTIPSHIIRACFIFCREIYDHYLSITTPNSDSNLYMKRKITLHEGFEYDYKIWESKSKIISGVVAQFCQKPEKKKQSALRVVEVLSGSLKNGGHQEKDLDRLCNEILLNLLPRSPYLLKEMQQINEKETPREDIVFILLSNEFQSRIKKDEQYVKAFSGTNLTDQKFVSKSVFFKAIVTNMKNENDHRQLLFERAYHYFILEKCLKNLKDHNFEEVIIQKFKQEKNINTPKELYERILTDINTQVGEFRKLWVSIAIAFSSCTNLEIPDAIKYLSWALKEMTMTTNKFTFPHIIKPYIVLVTKYLCQFNDIMLSNLIHSSDVAILKTVTIRVCLASLLKFYHLSPEISQLFIVAREQIKSMDPQILQQLEAEDYYVLNADPQNINKDLLIPVELTFSDLCKNERANISVEGCFAFSSYQEILEDDNNTENQTEQ
ncbi:hypothetical protein NAEGRDRAFT_78037 [Naegleria gruberi]|uniref:Uncharacterized protein n=1 Tax=Naegleria gruberi TaxID=5762 RepID=D2V0F3_NAEGR|nr:uncharacterized protein NAEGRDRAFT_78037 [Naegleria gruberi]EFC49516.1 hypothetical protein NAEGRDRAFT_78037 [Naegleria gruberi]|eukprot:XP_002682260.1 hypothetical protein NAEGRDRAFT_78037 [Naegleria gruberi strain NEG-M]